MRINRFLASCGLGSRRACEALIAAGRVRCNGQLATLSQTVAPGDRVEVDGTLVQPIVDTPQVWMLHKPAGVVSTALDPQGRDTVVDLAHRLGARGRIYPVGRLDRDTTGLLLLTNHGDLCHRLTHPSWEIDKEYVARVAQPLRQHELEALRRGIELDDGPTSPCEAWQVQEETTRVHLVLHEGRKRQVRRMLQALGHPVLALHRLRIGTLTLGTLPPGRMRALLPGEIATLERALRLDPAAPEPDDRD